jgi:hypothetical protein
MSEKTALIQEMTLDEFQKIEHEIQTGVRDTLPDGRKISDVQKALEELQKKQEKERGVKEGDTPKKPADASQTVEVTVTENGVMSARPVTSDVAPAPPEEQESDSDLPPEFPGRKALIAGGVLTLEAVAQLDKETLVGIKGIKEATADAILAYGKADAGAEE